MVPTPFELPVQARVGSNGFRPASFLAIPQERILFAREGYDRLVMCDEHVSSLINVHAPLACATGSMIGSERVERIMKGLAPVAA